MKTDRTVHVSAPAKIHLLGEHAVVFNKPALMAAVDLRCHAYLTPSNIEEIEITSKNISRTIRLTYAQLTSITDSAQSTWDLYFKTNDMSILKSMLPDEIDYLAIVVGETLKFYNVPHSVKGFSLVIDSQVPIGGGLGSSAACAVSIVGAVSLFLDKPLQKEIINEIAYIAEQKKHGLPSGGDNSTVCFGGLVWFRKETPDLKIIQPIPFTIPSDLSKKFTLINTGKPVESTGEMVSLVRALKETDPAVVEFFLQKQEQLTRELVGVVKNSNETEFIRIIREGESNLERIGVVSDYVKPFIRAVESSGGAAKICGAGGKIKATGIILAYSPDTATVEKLAKAHGFSYFSEQLGVGGVTEESL